MRRGLLLIPALAVLLAGCASVSGGASTGAVVAPSTTASDPAEVSAAWLEGGRLIGLVTFGSSSCVPAATDVALGPTGTLTVTLEDPDAACTRDFVPRATLVEVPADVDPSNGLEIALAGDYSGDTELAGVSGLAAGGEPTFTSSAGWAGGDLLVVLTYGSSGCPPMVSTVEPTGPASLTVTFETPPADQVCTMDIGPRVLVVSAPGLEQGVSAELTLAGGGSEFDPPETIPVAGTP